MGDSGVALFRVAGMEVRADVGWALLAALVTWSLAVGVFPVSAPGLTVPTYLALGAIGAVGLFASILAHEIAHAVVGRRFGVEVRRISLWIFGGVAESVSEADRPRTELWMALAGPLCSFVLSGIAFGLLAMMIPLGAPPWSVSVVDYLAWANLALAAFNLLPAFPLDGGRVLRAFLWQRSGDARVATDKAGGIGEAFGLAIVALGIGVLLGGAIMTGVWWILIGGFLRGAARAGRRQAAVQELLSRAPVYRIMDRYPDVVVPGLTLDRFMDEHVYARGRVLFPVVEDGGLVGCADAREARQIPRGSWKQRTVLDITRDIPADACIGPDASAGAALRQMEMTGWPSLLVTEEGRLEGIVSADDIGRYLAVRTEMEGPAPAVGQVAEI